jgi:DNA-binding MarR family transcriptional regulator
VGNGENAVLTGGEWDQLSLLRASKLAPRPSKLSDTGLSETFVTDLIAKHLLDRGTLSLAELSSILALAGSIIEGVLNFMRTEALIEVRQGKANATGLCYTLTDRGRAASLDAMRLRFHLDTMPRSSEFSRFIIGQ